MVINCQHNIAIAMPADDIEVIEILSETGLVGTLREALDEIAGVDVIDSSAKLRIQECARICSDWAEIDAKHGDGASINLDHSFIRMMWKDGHITPDKIQNAQRYRQENAANLPHYRTEPSHCKILYTDEDGQQREPPPIL